VQDDGGHLETILPLFLQGNIQALLYCQRLVPASAQHLLAPGLETIHGPIVPKCLQDVRHTAHRLLLVSIRTNLDSNIIVSAIIAHLYFKL